jgi:very-short-patch-repair endonuclease
VCPHNLNNRREVATPPLPDRQIARLAATQHGVVTRAQLLATGLDANAVDYRVKVGRLHRVHKGVFAVGHTSLSPLSNAMAAVLACGDGAVLSHRSAAALWNIDPTWRLPVEVTTTGNRRHRRVRAHRSRTLDAQDVTTRDGIPITTPARTVVDLADVLDDRALARAVNEAQVLRIMRLEELAIQLERSPGRRAMRRLRGFVERADGPTRSELEDEFLRFVERYDLPRPEINQTIAGYEVDAVWRQRRLVVELDSRRYHDLAQPFESDREKDANLLAAGFPVVRVTWWRLRGRPAAEADRLHTLLRQRTS